MKQAGTCSAIANNLDVIFANESSGALDLKSTLQILKILRRMNEEWKNPAIVMCDTKVAVGAERGVFMLDGCIVKEMKFGKYHHIGDENKSREE